jgi:lysophospholipase L1-like esterase
LISISGVLQAAEPAHESAPIRVLLLGDSTCIGSVCRLVEPKADHLEQVIEKLLAAEADLPPVTVNNQGRDGEYIHGLLTSGRYEKEIAPLKDLDYVLIRYGINDRNKREEFARNFPADYQELLTRLRVNHPQATIVLLTVIPYMRPDQEKDVNDIVRSLAAEQKLPLLDIHARYAAELKFGENMLNYRRMSLQSIPARYHALLGSALTGDSVVVLDNRLDVHMRDVPNWFGDRHPNLAGYHVIGDETARYLAPLIRERKKAK